MLENDRQFLKFPLRFITVGKVGDSEGGILLGRKWRVYTFGPDPISFLFSSYNFFFIFLRVCCPSSQSSSTLWQHGFSSLVQSPLFLLYYITRHVKSSSMSLQEKLQLFLWVKEGGSACELSSACVHTQNWVKIMCQLVRIESIKKNMNRGTIKRRPLPTTFRVRGWLSGRTFSVQGPSSVFTLDTFQSGEGLET